MKNLFLLFLLGFIALAKDNDEIKIIGGNDADIENHPWQIALYSNVSGFEEFGCGGSIIDEYWIITAAHCVYNFQINQQYQASEIVVKVGIEDLETNQSEFLIVDEIFMHQSYDPSNFNYDIALIRLTDPITLGSPNVSSIDLVTPEQFENGLGAPGTIATTSGWGATVPSGFESPTRLQYVKLPIVNIDTAFKWFKENPDYEDDYDFEAYSKDDQIAAGFEEGGKSSCYGDSGGPLTIRNEDDTKDILLGLVSWGPECAAEKTPGVYSSVPYYYNWINNIISVTSSVSKRNKIEFLDYNKFTQNLNIKLSNASTIVYDLLGNQVLSSSDKNIDVSSLPKGIYSVISISQNRSFTSTFLIGN